MTTRYACVGLIPQTHCAIRNWSKLSRPETWPLSCGYVSPPPAPERQYCRRHRSILDRL